MSGKKTDTRGNLILCFALLIGALVDLCAYQAQDGNLEAVEMILNQDYSGATRLLKQRLYSDPEDIEAMYLGLIVEQTRILDYESYVVEGDWFIDLAESVRNQIEPRVALLNGSDSLRGVFYLANIVGGIGMIQAKNGNWLEGARSAYSSVALLKNILKTDPEFVAAKLGIGLFDYYLGSSLSWIPFVGSRIERGVKMIQEATVAPLPYNVAAINSLCWIYMEQEKYAIVDSLVAMVLERYPDNSIYLKIRALAALRSGQYDKAVPVALSLIEQSKSRDPVNWSDHLTGYYILVKSYERTGNGVLAFATSEEILSIAIPEDSKTIPHIDRHLHYLTQVRDRFRETK